MQLSHQAHKGSFQASPISVNFIQIHNRLTEVVQRLDKMFNVCKLTKNRNLNTNNSALCIRDDCYNYSHVSLLTFHGFPWKNLFGM